MKPNPAALRVAVRAHVLHDPSTPALGSRQSCATFSALLPVVRALISLRPGEGSMPEIKPMIEDLVLDHDSRAHLTRCSAAKIAFVSCAEGFYG